MVSPLPIPMLSWAPDSELPVIISAYIPVRAASAKASEENVVPVVTLLMGGGMLTSFRQDPISTRAAMNMKYRMIVCILKVKGQASCQGLPFRHGPELEVRVYTIIVGQQQASLALYIYT